MTSRKNPNSILVLAILGVYFGLVLVGVIFPVHGQSSGQNAEPAKDQYGIYINKRPMKDFAVDVVGKIERKEIDLDVPFKVTITGSLGLASDGRTVILKAPKRVTDPAANSGDPAIRKLAEEAILAVADSGWFGYLSNLEIKDVVISLQQNETDFLARIQAHRPDENKTKTFASMLRMMLSIAGQQAKGDNATLINAATTGSDSKSFFISFKLSKEVFGEMIRRNLAGYKAKLDK